MNASRPSPEPNDILQFLSLLWCEGDVREIRILRHNKYGHTASGYFESAEAAGIAADAWDGRASVYITLNAVDRSLLARAVNRIDPRAISATADADVLRRTWMLVDIDPTRAGGISSTTAELATAEVMLTDVTAFLAGEGWPEPLTCMSGNGYHALYRVDLANDAEATALVKRVLEELARRFDNDAAHIDTSVFNAARIVALTGSVKMKGDSTANRPHRRSKIVSVPEVLAPVTRTQIEQLANKSASTAATKPTLLVVPRSTILSDMLRAAGLEFHEQPPDTSGVTWYHLKRCPFHDDGRDFECGVGQTLPGGPYAGHCFHPEGQAHGWQEFKRALGLHMGGHHDPAMVGVGSRPRIFVTNRYRRDIAEDSWQALMAANDPVRFFSHGNSAAEIDEHPDGAATIRHLGTVGLAGRLDRCADFRKITQTGEHPARPPRDVVEDMEALENRFPRLRGIVGAPTFGADGTLETATGYQPGTGLFYAPVGEPVPSVPARPDASDLRVARLRLGDDLCGDFPWADERASLANFIAALITPMVRELVTGPVPLFALDAPKAGNGKGLLATCISLVATGHDVSVMADTKNEEEFRKRVTTKLMEGDGVLLFDNVRRRLDSGAFAALLTANVWTDRVLGRSQAVTLPIRSLFLVTGNNLQFSDEMTRRVASIRLDAKTDRPWEGRSFRHPDLPGWLRRHRHEVVWACLVLAQNWIAQRRPEWSGHPMGTYESWCRVLGGILESAGIPGFLENRPDLYRRGDADSEEWRAFTSAWRNTHGESGVKVADLQSIAAETLVGFFDQLKEGADIKTIRTKLGKAIAERQDTRFEDLFVRRAGADGHSKTALWRVEAATTTAGISPENGTTPAPYPQEIDSFSDSFAGDAGIAGINSELLPQLVGSPDELYACGEIDNPYPQYPPPPQTDSREAPISAGDLRVTGLDDSRHPQCKRCGGASDLPSSNLCRDCRLQALSDVMEGQQ